MWKASLLVVIGLFTVIAWRVGTSPANEERASRILFRLWRIASPLAHGGQYVEVNGIRLYYETYGAGPPVVVLHGGFGSLVDMHHQIWSLSHADRFVIAIDNRGHGRSSDGDAPLSYHIMSDDTAALLETLHLARADIVGWSDGGIIGLDLAMRHPELVGHLIVMSANFDPSGLRELPPIDVVPPKMLWAYARTAPNPQHWPVFFTKMMTMWRTEPHYTRDDLERIRAPTLIMAGQFDLIKPDHTEQLAESIPNARLIIVPNAGHWLPSERPAQVNQAIEEFLHPAT